MEQHPVPQHIASFEFKLFGNLTVRQFVTLAIPMSLAAVVYFSALPVVIRLPLALVIGLFALFAALVPIGGRPFDKWIVAFIKAVTSPTQRVWVKESKIPEFLSVVTAVQPTEEHIPESITAQGRARLRDYLRSLPKGEVTPLDVKEQIAVQRLDLETSVGASFSLGETSGGKLPPPIIWPTSRPFSASSLPQINAAPKLTTAQIPVEGQFEGEMENALPQVAPTVSHPKIAPHAKPFALPGLEKRLKKKEEDIVELTPTAPLVRAKLASEVNAAVESVIPVRTGDKKIKLIHGIGKTRVRKLHFAPPVGFDLAKLPIRGEKRFEISEELKKRYQPAEDLFAQSLPNNNAHPRGVPASQAKLGEQGRSSAHPGGVMSHTDLPHVPKSVPKPVKSTFVSEDVSLKREKTAEGDSQIAIHGQRSADLPLSSILTPAQIVPLTNRPNVVSGVVCDSRKAPLENVILVVKDANGIPMRAFKTNKLGQFLSATPLPNGTYTIEVESEIAQFWPLSVLTTGQILSPLEIMPKGEVVNG